MYKFANRENSFAVSLKFSAGKVAKQRWMPCFNKSFLTDAYLRRRFKTFTKNSLCKYARCIVTLKTWKNTFQLSLTTASCQSNARPSNVMRISVCMPTVPYWIGKIFMDRAYGKYDLFALVSEVLPFMGDRSLLDCIGLVIRARLSLETRRWRTTKKM